MSNDYETLMGLTAVARDIKRIFKLKIERKLSVIKEELYKHNIRHFYIGGGAFYSNHDIDLFPVVENGFKASANDLIPIANTANAKTYHIADTSVQLCKYYYPSLQKLVESFDFSHCKIGGEFKIVQSYTRSRSIVHTEELYISDDFVTANLTQNTTYTGSKHPLSSLIRVVKYAIDGRFHGRSYMNSIIQCVTDICDRGFSNYDDFKDQLDAVDLGLIPDSIDSLNTNSDNIYGQLFTVLHKPCTDKKSNSRG